MWNSALNYKARLSYWKELRNHIKTDISYLGEVSKIPYGLYHREVDYYTPSSWPTPWDILELKVLCRSCVGILVYHTIRIAFPDSNPEILLIDNSEEEWLVVKYDNLIYNFLPGKACSLDTLTNIATIKMVFDGSEIKQC